MVAAACIGLGLAQVPDYVVRDELADGRLVEVLCAHRPEAMPISAVYPGARLLPARVRALLDVLETLRDAGTPPVGRDRLLRRAAGAKKRR
jgi:DNA-binding transcriptional LysR family regulator